MQRLTQSLSKRSLSDKTQKAERESLPYGDREQMLKQQQRRELKLHWIMQQQLCPKFQTKVLNHRLLFNPPLSRCCLFHFQLYKLPLNPPPFLLSAFQITSSACQSCYKLQV
jgi:hypothetical protein